ncbi:FkbM family methyltransferase [Frankia sp. AiPs1]|uniref:FkbM family methyltransferase n=1 Tax=Frankia sp. AiPs1 TaxID=573493 RepID=UPI0020447402|nr:FkbM family methyltransferase [Frankia sp. AiPs1]MCM3926406.1 FkbM family methyltransferase [Frankia sp. AiPs1]
MAAALPDVRGRDRVTGWVRGTPRFTGPVRGRLTNGMTFELADCRDGSARDLVELCYRPPALAAVFDTILRPGDCCYDVGANIGVYTLWAAGAVGRAGEVHAFEPVPEPRAVLVALTVRNGLSQVRPTAWAVGAVAGTVGLRRHPGASGLTHQVPAGDAAELTVPTTTLDMHAARHRPPDLIKIDVEGFELEVLLGATELLRARRPAVLLEMLPSHLARRGGRAQGELVGVLAAAGYRLFNLTRRGLAGQGEFSANVLALHPDWARFGPVVVALRRTPFPRNQTT